MQTYCQLELKVLLGQASDKDLAEMLQRRPTSRDVTPRPTHVPIGVSLGTSTSNKQLLKRGDAGVSRAQKAQQEKLKEMMLMKRMAQGGRVAAGGGALGDRRVCELEDHAVSAGCTAVAVLHVGHRLVTANCGDSRAIVGCFNNQVVPLSFDHKPVDDIERNRIVAAGGFLTEAQGHFRINGNLNLSRSLGDMKYKQNLEKSPAEQILTANPDITVHELTPEDEFMIVACDGVWDVFTDQEAVDLIRDAIVEKQAQSQEGHGPVISESEAAKLLVHKSIERGSADNITAIVIFF